MHQAFGHNSARRLKLFALFGLLVSMLLGSPAFAQEDPSGEWATVFHEDEPERIPGPDIGDYLGLPINDAARLRGDSWDATLLDASRTSVQPASLRLRLARPRPSPHLEGSRPDHRAPPRLSHAHFLASARTHHLDGRPHPSARLRAPHLAGFLDRQMAKATHWPWSPTHLKDGWIRRNGIPAQRPTPPSARTSCVTATTSPSPS